MLPLSYWYIPEYAFQVSKLMVIVKYLSCLDVTLGLVFPVGKKKHLACVPASIGSIVVEAAAGPAGLS